MINMSNMTFSYAGNSDNNNISKITTKLFNVNTKKVSIQNNNERTNMLFSNKSSLHGSMFQRIQYATSGCSACGK